LVIGGSRLAESASFSTISGRELIASMASSGARAVLVNAWASWCTPCRDEVLGLALAGGWLALRLLQRNWNLGGHFRLAAVGVLELILFVIVRAASAEHLARVIGPFEQEWLRNLLELPTRWLSTNSYSLACWMSSLQVRREDSSASARWPLADAHAGRQFGHP